MHRNPVIGDAIRKFTPKGEFINAKINKALLMSILEDENGDIHLTLAEKKSISNKPNAVTHVIYEDDFIGSKKNIQ